jgi:hypothetical protein
MRKVGLFRPPTVRFTPLSELVFTEFFMDDFEDFVLIFFANPDSLKRPLVPHSGQIGVELSFRERSGCPV